MLIFMDDREPQGQEEIALLVSKDIKLLRHRMKEGDYVWNDVVVERKQIDDFCSSILDGRLVSQVEKMKEKFNNVFVIVVGRIGDRKSMIHENCVLGKYLSLVMKHKVVVLFVENEFQFFYLLRRIVERFKEEREEEFLGEVKV